MAHHHHDHDHSHAHGHAADDFGFAFAVGIALNTAFVVAELIFGYAANSLALISDAVHNFSDVIALVLAWAAAWLARKRPTERHTYGYRRASILAALANAGLLLIAVGAIAVEAIDRIRQPAEVASFTVILVAALGIIINGGTALLFMRGRHGDLNIRGAYLHMAADAGVSLGVVVAAFLVTLTGWLWIDPATAWASQPWCSERVGARQGECEFRARRRAEGHCAGGCQGFSGPARWRDRRARLAHLGDEHQRNGADSASGAARRP